MNMNLSQLWGIVKKTGKPGVLQYMGSQSGHDLATEQQHYHIIFLSFFGFFIYFCYRIHSRANFLIMFFFFTAMKMEMKLIFNLPSIHSVQDGELKDDR